GGACRRAERHLYDLLSRPGGAGRRARGAGLRATGPWRRRGGSVAAGRRRGVPHRAAHGQGSQGRVREHGGGRSGRRLPPPHRPEQEAVVSSVFDVVRAETLQALRQRRVYALAALYRVLLPALALLVGRLIYVNTRGTFVEEGVPLADLMQSLFSSHGLATIALTGPAYASPTPYIIAVALMAALFIGEERGQNMWKTVLVVQPSRSAVLTGKLIVTMGTLLVLMLGAFLTAILFGTIGTVFVPTNLSGDWGGLLGLYLWQWAHLLAPVLLAFLLIFLVRSAVLGIVVVLIAPGLLEGIYSVLNTLFSLQPVTRF